MSRKASSFLRRITSNSVKAMHLEKVDFATDESGKRTGQIGEITSGGKLKTSDGTD